MTTLHQLYQEFGQSPWLDELRPADLAGGRLDRWIADGVRGAILSLARLPLEAVMATAAAFLPLYDASDAADGLVCVEVPPDGLDDPADVDARELFGQAAKPNVVLSVPAVEAGVAEMQRLIGGGRGVIAAPVCSIGTYARVIEAYLSGLEASPGGLSTCHNIAVFALGDLDAEVDRRLEEIGSPTALALRGRAGSAQAKIAYRLFQERFFGARWQALARRGAKVQRLTWVVHSSGGGRGSGLQAAEDLIGGATICALPGPSMSALLRRGHLARSLDVRLDEADAVLGDLAHIGIDLRDASEVAERSALTGRAKP
jgi:transaldolase